MEKRYEILVATDYSNAAGYAEQYAIQFAKKTNSSIVFLHVYPTPISIPLDTLPVERSEYDPVKYENERLKDHIKNIFSSSKVNENEISSRTIVREGSLVKQIQIEVKESGIDFVFIGTHGASGFKDVLLGSNAWKIIKNSTIPVMAIPKDAHSFTGIKRIVYATEYREGEIPVINYLTTFARPFDAEIIVLHVSNRALSKELERSIYEKFRDDVKSENSYQNLDIHFIYNEDVVEGLNTFCVRTKTDLLVMSPEKHLLFEKIFNPSASMTKKVSYNTHIPLLAVPDSYDPEYSDFWKMVEQTDQYWNEDI